MHRTTPVRHPVSPYSDSAALAAGVAALVAIFRSRERENWSVNPPAKYPIFEAVRMLSVEARELSSEGFDGLQAERAGLRILVLSDVEAL